MNDPSRTRLKSKLLRLVLGVMSLVTLSILGLVAWLNTETEQQRLLDLEGQVRANIAGKANVLVDSHALALRGLVADNAFAAVREMVARAAASDGDIVYGLFVSADGSAWAYASPSTAGKEELTQEEIQTLWKELNLPPDSWKSATPVQVFGRQFDRELFEVSRPVIDEGEVLGMVRYGFSTEPLIRALADARLESKRALRGMLQGIALTVFICTLVGFLLVSRAASKITRPLVALTDATDRIATGERGVRVAVESNDELAALAAAFNHMQEANEEAMKRLSDAMEAALEASRMKSEFLANMSHEIRTPMNGVIGMIRLILKLPLEGKLRRYAETVDASAGALLTIINDVLDFSKMEAGKYTLQSVPFDPGTVVQDVAELLAGRAYDKQLELVHRKAPDVPSMVTGDPDRYRQILTNLVGNAIKFTDEGEIFIEVTLDEATEDAYVIRTVVQDSGIGIASDDVERVFDAFSQADGSMSRKHGGTGLGLAISKRLVEMMGGQIGVQSEKGVGSKFWFTVRVEHSSAPERPALSTLPAGRRALVVEGSRRWCRVISEHLSVWGLPCDIFQDGKPALERLRSPTDGNYDVAVVGSHLRDISIEAFVRELRAIPSAGKLPLIVLTQLGSVATLSEVEKEVAAQVTKPLRLSELYDCILGSLAGTTVASSKPRQQVRLAKNRGRKILVVDDNEINRYVAAEQIESVGFEVDLATNGEEAVELVKKNNYSAVLMDCQMPVMDGYTATRTIRQWEGKERHVPIIALTAHAMAGERDKVLAAGMDDYLAKPLRPHALERMLERYVGEDGRPSKPTSSAPAPPPAVELDATIPRSAKLVDLFLSRVPETLVELDAAVGSGDPKAVRDRAHKLKGSCLAIGANAMAKEAETLQFEAERGVLEQASVRASTLWVQYDRVAILLSNEAPAPADGAPVEPATPDHVAAS